MNKRLKKLYVYLLKHNYSISRNNSYFSSDNFGHGHIIHLASKTHPTMHYNIFLHRVNNE